MEGVKKPSESFKYVNMLWAISNTSNRRVALPFIEGHHCSTTLFHLVCSAKVDTREGRIIYDSLKGKVIQSGLAQKHNILVEEVQSRWNDICIDKRLHCMLTNATEPINVLHETVELTVLFFTQPTEKNDNEANSAIMPKQIERFLVNKSKEILKGKLGSAIYQQVICRDSNWKSFKKCYMTEKETK